MWATGHTQGSACSRHLTNGPSVLSGHFLVLHGTGDFRACPLCRSGRPRGRPCPVGFRFQRGPQAVPEQEVESEDHVTSLWDTCELGEGTEGSFTLRRWQGPGCPTAASLCSDCSSWASGGPWGAAFSASRPSGRSPVAGTGTGPGKESSLCSAGGRRTCLALTWGRAASSPAPLPRQSVCVRLPGSSPWRWVSPGFCGWKEAAASGLFSVVASHCHCSQDTVLSVARVQWSPRGR